MEDKSGGFFSGVKARKRVKVVGRRQLSGVFG